MKSVIALLQIQRETLANNLPINEAEGDHDQAKLEHETIAEIDQALQRLTPINFGPY